MSEEIKWGEEIVDFINKKLVEIEDSLKRFQYFKLLARGAEHEAAHAAENFDENDFKILYTEETDDE